MELKGPELEADHFHLTSKLRMAGGIPPSS
jgi:hypothetical protein